MHERLKKIQNKKKRDAEAEVVRKALLAEEGLETVVEVKIPDAVEDFDSENDEGSRNLLGSKDVDVIF